MVQRKREALKNQIIMQKEDAGDGFVRLEVKLINGTDVILQLVCCSAAGLCCVGSPEQADCSSCCQNLAMLV